MTYLTDKNIQKKIEKYIGKPCKDIGIGCPTCHAHLLFATGQWEIILKDIEDTKKWEKEYKAECKKTRVGV